MENEKAKKVAGQLWKGTKIIGKATKTGIEKAAPHVKQASDASIQATKKAASKTTDLVATGVHRVMGSDEYKRGAIEVNERLRRALQTLESAIKSRDREISELRRQVESLKTQLKESNRAN